MLITHAFASPDLGRVELTESLDSTTDTTTISAIQGRVIVERDGRLNRITATLNIRTDLFLEHGWQSWSAVRLATPSDVRPERAHAPRWFRAQMLADRDGAGRELAGDTFLVHDGGTIGALANDSHFTRVVVAPDGALRIEWLMDDIRVTKGQEITLAAHLVIEGQPGESYSTYVERATPPTRRSFTPVPAWCSWYQYFGEISPAIIRENLTLAVAHGVSVVQIDDGWQREIGVWTDVAPTWGEPMSDIARDIEDAGCVPGIWTAPFLAIEDGTLHRHHPEWLVRNENDQPTTALFHGGWGGRIFALDTTHPDVLAHIEQTYRYLRAQGFTYFKIDFLHAGAAVGARRRDDLTRAQAFVAGLAAVRRGIGEDAVLVGCGSPLLAASGYVDVMRVSEDVAPFFLPRQFFDGFPENTVAAQNALEASLLRAPLHARWFTLDPDCILLRTTETDLSQHERNLVVRGAAAASPFLVVSDRLALYSDEEWELAHSLWQNARHGVRHLPNPLERPLQVNIDGDIASFDIWKVPPSLDTGL